MIGFCLMLAAGGTFAVEKPIPPSGPVIWEFFPEAEFYPYYLADPMRPQGAIMGLYALESDIPDSGSPRFSLRLGGRFPLVHYHPDGRLDRGWQIDFEGGFIGLFDMGNGLDNIGWDGFYGIFVSYMPLPNFGVRVGTQHDSAHVGDEYAQRTGRLRVGYTREELAAGLSWRMDPHWHLYAEGGYAYTLKQFQERLRLQAGLEYFGAKKWQHGRIGWYAALDLRGYSETGWTPRSTAQIGIMIPTDRGTNKYRVAFEIGTGRSILGEFFENDETYAAFGLYFDY